ncbi:MAG: phenylalanine--tRNA ligase subunit beta, partial [Armatimonadetes bacterium]|nr:phenylalanine--tRNA ligase subunit beta [Armatimonadota bacterium]
DYAEELGLPNETFMAELDLLVFAIQDDIEHPLVQVSKNPSIRRDIAVVVPKTVSYQSIEKAINEACGDILERQWLFDVYEGKGINPGDHSLAIAMQFRKPGANLTDEDANGFRNQAIEALKALGGQLR